MLMRMIEAQRKNRLVSDAADWQVRYTANCRADKFQSQIANCRRTQHSSANESLL
jgi:hypothetical protein